MCYGHYDRSEALTGQTPEAIGLLVVSQIFLLFQIQNDSLTTERKLTIFLFLPLLGIYSKQVHLPRSAGFWRPFLLQADRSHVQTSGLDAEVSRAGLRSIVGRSSQILQAGPKHLLRPFVIHACAEERRVLEALSPAGRSVACANLGVGSRGFPGRATADSWQDFPNSSHQSRGCYRRVTRRRFTSKLRH